MSYTYNITSKGQITIPKEMRDKLELDKTRQATIRMNKKGEIVITRPKTVSEVRDMLKKPSFKDPVSKKEKTIGESLAKKYGLR